jgi:hypothetical protein
LGNQSGLHFLSSHWSLFFQKGTKSTQKVQGIPFSK